MSSFAYFEATNASRLHFYTFDFTCMAYVTANACNNNPVMLLNTCALLIRVHPLNFSCIFKATVALLTCSGGVMRGLGG